MIKYFTEIHLCGLVLRDPVTIITNILLFASALWSSRRIRKIPTGIAGAKEWSLFFLFLSVSGLLGMFTHGFSYYTTEEQFFPIWVSSGWIQMIGVLFAQVAAAKIYLPAKVKLVLLIGLIQMIVCGIIMVIIRKFLTVDMDTGLVLMPIAIINIIRVKRGKAASNQLSIGILSSAIPALITVFKLSPSPWFNFNDISHLLVCVSTIIMCLGLEKNLRSAA